MELATDRIDPIAVMDATDAPRAGTIHHAIDHATAALLEAQRLHRDAAAQPDLAAAFDRLEANLRGLNRLLRALADAPSADGPTD